MRNIGTTLIIRFVLGTIFAVLVVMIEVTPDQATNALAAWFRKANMPAEWLSGSFVNSALSYVVPALIALAIACFFGPLIALIRLVKNRWIRWAARSQNLRRTAESYLRDEDTELGCGIRDMATYSAWAKWFASQHLATNNHKPVHQFSIMHAASSIVLDDLMNGKLRARGRPSGAIEYEDIPKEAWRLIGIHMRSDRTSLWRGVIIPRSGVDPARISKLLDYDSIIVNSGDFQTLWPRSDKEYDVLRKKLLKEAKKAGADQEDIKKLSQGHMATWP